MLFPAEYTDTDWSAIERAVHETASKVQSEGKAWVRSIDPHHVYRQIRERQVESVISEGYLVVFAVGVPWYSPAARFLEELMVMRLDPQPGRFRVVVQTLLKLAARASCDGVAAGTALTADARLRRVYERFGFRAEADSLFKSIKE
ncbi:hypothetical protein [Ralstonia syzygii]|uniref:N-acetyltransferase domain-containing protein n=1 Tax=blood disease bacterium R229 TaxID=741978 RepID=G2ZVZ8_9RALS|nr:hypothetical protein [Ralstonia syzygii]CCA83279.1 hypothetical protein BDB_mp60445 [blood disease bacterium R229]